MEQLRRKVETEGFFVADGLLSAEAVAKMIFAMEKLAKNRSTRARGGVFAVRNLLEISQEVRELACAEIVRGVVEPVLGEGHFAVRGILFDKISTANWKVPWHQDVTIAVRERVDTPGFGPWSMKADVLHVQAPAAILESMLTVRIHLDDCHERNGALRVLPGTHRMGKIPESEIEGIRRNVPERVCAVGTGGALLMRPLLLHASSSSEIPGHRRVIHLDFASTELPGEMRWLSQLAESGGELLPVEEAV